MQLPTIIVLLGLVLALMEFNESYEIEPHEFYKPRSLRRLRWHPLPNNRKRYRPKKMPSQRYHLYEPDLDHRYASHDDFLEADYDRPYVIVIHFPRKNDKKEHTYQKHVTSSQQNNDYINNANELKAYQLNNFA